MKYFLVAIMIVLLSVRGWTAQQMSVVMGATSTSAMPVHCPMLEPMTDGVPQDFKICNTCQLCMGIAALALDLFTPVSVGRPAAPAPLHEVFVSVAPSRRSKPPPLITA